MKVESAHAMQRRMEQKTGRENQRQEDRLTSREAGMDKRQETIEL